MDIYHSRITKLILNHLGFLVTDCKMEFAFQQFEEYKGFCGPINTYSFYNKYGCFTLQNIVQKNEWGWFLSSCFSNDQCELLKEEIDQFKYLQRHYFLFSGWLRALGKKIKEEVQVSNTVFAIPCCRNEITDMDPMS